MELPFDNLVSAPVWSPDGNQIAIATSTEDGGFELAVLSDINDEPVQIASGRATQPKIRWSPNGDWIAFESQRNIYIVTPTGEDYRQVTQGNMHFLGDWSSDGQKLALSVNNGDRQYMIMVSIETGDSREVTHPREGIFDYFVSWTPDGKSVLFSTNRFSENLSLYRYNLPDATSEKYVDSMVVSVSWNPSGNHFVYAVSNNGFNEIYTRNLFTGEEVLLNEGFIILHENYTRPVWSPDGSLVAFEAIDREATVYRIGIFILNLDNSEIIRITSNTTNEYGPYWIPCLP
jgi:Tol biopolymer transport system component